MSDAPAVFLARDCLWRCHLDGSAVRLRRKQPWAVVHDLANYFQPVLLQPFLSTTHSSPRPSSAGPGSASTLCSLHLRAQALPLTPSLCVCKPTLLRPSAAQGASVLHSRPLSPLPSSATHWSCRWAHICAVHFVSPRGAWILHCCQTFSSPLPTTISALLRPTTFTITYSGSPRSPKIFDLDSREQSHALNPGTAAS
ncbi:hypothetical protein BKA80DRAFT_7642 [Phyllosticta citrichinensis]